MSDNILRPRLGAKITLAVMNPRRVHELMLHNFPEFNYVDHDWAIAVDQNGARTSVISSLLDKYIEGDEIVIEIHRKQGACLNRADAIKYIVDNASSGMKIADRKFQGFVVVSSNGVATGWRREGVKS